jgi:DHA1 family bicyclomycin/chloramphenicol resistance-like MFS transporter
MRWLRHPPFGSPSRPPLWLIFCFVISGTLSLHIFVPALPAAARELGASPGVIQLTITVYVIGLAVGQLAYGPLSDKFGRRPVLMAGLLLYTLSSIVAGLAPTAGALIGARVFQALGGCSGLVLGRAVIRDTCEPREVTAQLAWLNMFMSMAPAAAPLVGSTITAFASWRTIYGVLAVMGGLTLAAALMTLHETNQSLGRGHAGLLHSYLRLLAIPSFRVFTFAGACSTTSFYAFLSAAAFIFMDMLGTSQGALGFYLLSPMLGYSLGNFITNRLSARFAPDRVLRLGFIVGIAGSAMFVGAVVTGHLSVVTVLVGVFIFNTGSGIVSPLALSAAISVLPTAIGAASGLYGFVQMGFGALCTAIVAISPANPALTASLVMLASTVASGGAYLRYRSK